MARAQTAQTKADMRRQAAREAREASRRAEAAESGVQRRMAKMREAQLEKQLAATPAPISIEEDQEQTYADLGYLDEHGDARENWRSSTAAPGNRSHLAASNRSPRGVHSNLGSPNGMSEISGAASPSKALRDLQNRPRQVKLSIMEEFRRELEEIEVLKEVLRERYFNECRERLEEGHRAAIEIQRIIRARIARERVQTIIDERAALVYGPEHHAAAVKVQAQYRRRAVEPLIAEKRRDKLARRREAEAKRAQKKALRKQAEEQRWAEEEAAIEAQQRLRADIKAKERLELQKDVERQKKVAEEMRREQEKRAEAEARTLQGARKRHAAEMARTMEQEQNRLQEQIANTNTSYATTKQAPVAEPVVKLSSPVQQQQQQQLSPAPSVDEDLPVSPAALPVEESRIDPTPANEESSEESIPDIGVVDASIEAIDNKAGVPRLGSTKAPLSFNDDDDDDDDDDNGLAGLLELAQQTKAQASAREREEEGKLQEESETHGQAGDADSTGDDDDDSYGGFSNSRRPESKTSNRAQDSFSNRVESPSKGNATNSPKHSPVASPTLSLHRNAGAAVSNAPVADYEDDFEDLDEIAL